MLFRSEIGVLLCTTPFSGHNLTAQTGMQINRLQIDDATYLQEDDVTKKMETNRIISFAIILLAKLSVLSDFNHEHVFSE